MTTAPTIVISAFDRPFSLKRLLSSLDKSFFEVEVKLIISIDGEENELVKQIANSYHWKFGPKQVIIHKKNLGLKEHILACGDLVNEHESIILLEDDIYVSPCFYEFACSAASFYQMDERISGISLYSYMKTEYDDQHFIPYNDGSDVFFMQIPSSWGQVFGKKGWNKFRNWLVNNESELDNANIPSQVKEWGIQSWKKHFMHYMVESDTYFVFPQHSLTTNFEDPGTNSNFSGKFHVPIQFGSRDYKFISLDKSTSVYDAWFEMKKNALDQINPVLSQYSYEVDFYGYKEKYDHEYLLTNKQMVDPIYTFSSSMNPAIQNVMSHLTGKGINFGPVSSLSGSIGFSKSADPIVLIVPLLTFEENKVLELLDQINQLGGINFSVVFSIHKDNLELYQRIYNEHLHSEVKPILVTSSSSSYQDLLLKGLEKVKTGIVTWLPQGSILSPGKLLIVSKVFQDIRQVNAITVVNSKQQLQDFRLTNELISYEFRKGNGRIAQNPVFFKAHMLPQIIDHWKQTGFDDSDFYPSLLFSITKETDILPVIPPDFSLQIKDDQEIIIKFRLDRDKKTGEVAGNLLKYRVLKWLAKNNIYFLRNLYYIVYQIPLVVHCEDLEKRAYLYNR